MDVLIIGPLGILEDGVFELVEGTASFNKSVAGAQMRWSGSMAQLRRSPTALRGRDRTSRAQNPAIDIRVSVWWTNDSAAAPRPGLCAAAAYNQSALHRLAASARDFLTLGLRGLDVDCEAAEVEPNPGLIDAVVVGCWLAAGWLLVGCCLTPWRWPPSQMTSNVIPNFPAFAEAVQSQFRSEYKLSVSAASTDHLGGLVPVLIGALQERPRCVPHTRPHRAAAMHRSSCSREEGRTSASTSSSTPASTNSIFMGCALSRVEPAPTLQRRSAR